MNFWNSTDTWIVVTSALAGMACALPGSLLVLRRQSLMGDALSHVALPGIVVAYLLGNWLADLLQLPSHTAESVLQILLTCGAVVVGGLTAYLTELVGKASRLDSGAVLGVVFTSLFALGLLLLRTTANRVHLDAACVLYGSLETAVLETYPGTSIPLAALFSGSGLVLAGTLVLLLRKELCLAAFDPEYAESIGFHPRWLNHGLMALTAIVVVIAFRSVGSILVIAMLIIPPCIAGLLTERFPRLLILSLLVAGCCGFLGHLLAITVPSLLFTRLGYRGIPDASSAGMTAVAAGLLLVIAVLFSPRQGLLRRGLDRFRLSVRIAMEDVLGLLFRLEERGMRQESRFATRVIAESNGLSRWVTWYAMHRLIRKGRVCEESNGYALTESGRAEAKEVVRSHRLWEVYMARYFQLPDDHLHATAAQVEHYLNPALRAELAAELAEPALDPHGNAIPPE